MRQARMEKKWRRNEEEGEEEGEGDKKSLQTGSDRIKKQAKGGQLYCSATGGSNMNECGGHHRQRDPWRGEGESSRRRTETRCSDAYGNCVSR